MSDRGLALAVSILAVILLVLLATVTIQKGIVERDSSPTDKVVLLTSDGQPIESGAYSLQQAFALCKRDAVRKAGADLLSINFDADSSRFLQSEKVFEVFLDAYIRVADEDRQEFVVCKVSASNNKIVEFRMKSVKGIWGGM